MKKKTSLKTARFLDCLTGRISIGKIEPKEGKDGR